MCYEVDLSVVRKLERSLVLLLTHPGFTLAWTGAFVGAGLFRAMFHADTSTLPQAGAMVVVGGILLTSRRMIRLGAEGEYHQATHIDYGHIAPTPDEVEKNSQTFKDFRSAHFGFWFIFFGTLLWAFGEDVAEVLSHVGT